MINLKKEQENEVLKKMFSNSDEELNNYDIRLHQLMSQQGVQVMRPNNCFVTMPPSYYENSFKVIEEPKKEEIIILKKGSPPKLLFSQRKLIKFIKQLIGFVENEEAARKLTESIDKIDTTIEGEISRYEINETFNKLDSGK